MSNRYTHTDVKTALKVLMLAVSASVKTPTEINGTVYYGNSAYKIPYILCLDGRHNIVLGKTSREACQSLHAMTEALRFVKETNTP